MNTTQIMNELTKKLNQEMKNIKKNTKCPNNRTLNVL